MTYELRSPLSVVTLRELSRHWRLPCRVEINPGQSIVELFMEPNQVKLEAVLQMTQAEELPGRS